MAYTHWRVPPSLPPSILPSVRRPSHLLVKDVRPPAPVRSDVKIVVRLNRPPVASSSFTQVAVVRIENVPPANEMDTSSSSLHQPASEGGEEDHFTVGSRSGGEEMDRQLSQSKLVRRCISLSLLTLNCATFSTSKP